MKNGTLAVWLITLVVTACAGLLTDSAVLANGATAMAEKPAGNQWLATGIVTRTVPGGFYLLGKDDIIYRIDAAQAVVVFNDKPSTLTNVKVGDRVRVFGKLTGEKNVKALRLNILGSAPVVETTPPTQSQTIPEQPAIVVPAPEATPPVVQPQVPTPAPLPGLGRGPEIGQTYRTRGLIKDIHLTEGWITVLTGAGPVMVDIDQAQVFSRGKSSSFSDLSAGDAVYIWGEQVTEGQVMAAKVDILAHKSEADAIKPANPVSAVGLIKSLDYPSFTFVLDNGTGPVFVMAGENANILSAGGKKASFSDLKVGMKVKVSGLGSLTTGYLAQQIVVVGSKR